MTDCSLTTQVARADAQRRRHRLYMQRWRREREADRVRREILPPVLYHTYPSSLDAGMLFRLPWVTRDKKFSELMPTPSGFGRKRVA